MSALAELLAGLREAVALGGPVVALLGGVSIVALAVVLAKLWQFRGLGVGRHEAARSVMRTQARRPPRGPPWREARATCPPCSPARSARGPAKPAPAFWPRSTPGSRASSRGSACSIPSFSSPRFSAFSARCSG